MSYMKNAYIGYQLVKDHAETLLSAVGDVNRCTMDPEQLTPIVDEIAGKLLQLANDVLEVHAQEQHESARDWRATLRDIRSRLKKKMQDTARWQEQKKELRAWSSQPPESALAQMEKATFTKNAVVKMKAAQVSEADCLDVLFHGSQIKEAMMARKYNGYEIGIVFGRDKRTGQYIIFSVWKRERR